MARWPTMAPGESARERARRVLRPVPAGIRPRGGGGAALSRRRPGLQRRADGGLAARGGARRCGAGRLSGAGPVGLHLRRPVPPARAARRLRSRAGAGTGGVRDLHRGGRGRAAAARGPLAVQLRRRRAPRPAAGHRAQDLPAELRRVLRGAPVQPGRPCASARDPAARPGRAFRRGAAVRGAGPVATSSSTSRSARTCGCRSRPRPMRRWPAPRCC